MMRNLPEQVVDACMLYVMPFGLTFVGAAVGLGSVGYTAFADKALVFGLFTITAGAAAGMLAIATNEVSAP